MSKVGLSQAEEKPDGTAAEQTSAETAAPSPTERTGRSATAGPAKTKKKTRTKKTTPRKKAATKTAAKKTTTKKAATRSRTLRKAAGSAKTDGKTEAGGVDAEESARLRTTDDAPSTGEKPPIESLTEETPTSTEDLNGQEGPRLVVVDGHRDQREASKRGAGARRLRD